MGRKPKVKTEKFDEKKMETAYDFGSITVPTKWEEVTLQMLSDYQCLCETNGRGAQWVHLGLFNLSMQQRKQFLNMKV